MTKPHHIIHHLVWRGDWTRLRRGDAYHADSLAQEGFIHCTREPEKVVEIANLFFAGPPPDELLVIVIDADRLTARCVDEDPGVGHFFPHVYGPLNLDAVLEVRTLPRGEDHWRSWSEP